MEITELRPGMENVAEEAVTQGNTAAALGSGSLPVYATPAMACLMERAAAELARRHLPEGWTSVGISLALKHVAATPVGGHVRAEARVAAVEGRKIRYEIRAFDEREEIGSCVHERFAVQEGKFLAKAEGKREAAKE